MAQTKLCFARRWQVDVLTVLTWYDTEALQRKDTADPVTEP